MKQKNKKSSSVLDALRSTLAESLIETIIAVTIIALGATGAGVMVRTSIVGVDLSQDRMLALNLSREGIEAVRNIRDTNWLRYGANKENCWNTLTGTDITDCENELIENGIYAVKIDNDTNIMEYFLEEDADGELVYACEIDAGTLYMTPSTVDGSCVETDFTRTISIEYETDDLMIVTSEVTWVSNGDDKEVSLTEKIGNW